MGRREARREGRREARRKAGKLMGKQEYAGTREEQIRGDEEERGMQELMQLAYDYVETKEMQNNSDKRPFRDDKTER